MEDFVLVIVLLIFMNITFSFLMFKDALEDDFEHPFLCSYKSIYDNTEMNMLGCLVCSLLLIIITSVYHIPAFICWFVYKIFHVGRRK